MTCEEIEQDDIAEQYVLGRLDDEARARFEAHYFDCPRCLDRVEQLESVRTALTNVTVPTTDVPFLRPWRWRAAAGLAAAAALLLAIRVIQESPNPQPGQPAAAQDIELPTVAPSIDVARLGAIDPPRFTPPRLRSSDASESRRVFAAAMEMYNRGDYGGAVDGLEEAVRADPTFTAAHFFLGVSYLQLDRRPEAVEHLREVTRLGESPYLEDAHFFLAKAAIRNRDFEAARRELRLVVALDGDRREDASRLITELQ